MKSCERCGREFFPSSNRQKWCRLCRPLVAAERERVRPRPYFGPRFVPRERSCEVCGVAFLARVANARFCRPCRAVLRLVKYGPGSGHQEARKAWKPHVRAGVVRCARGRGCVFAVDGVAGLILPGQAWDLGHVDGDPTRYAGPEHRRCNRRTASHRVARERGEGSREW